MSSRIESQAKRISLWKNDLWEDHYDHRFFLYKNVYDHLKKNPSLVSHSDKLLEFEIWLVTRGYNLIEYKSLKMENNTRIYFGSYHHVYIKKRFERNMSWYVFEKSRSTGDNSRKANVPTDRDDFYEKMS